MNRLPSVLLLTAMSIGSGLEAFGQQLAPRRLPVAAVVTEYRHNAHADVIVGRVVQGYELNDRPPFPSLRLAGLYTDRVPQSDTSRALAKKHGFPVFDSVEKSLTLGTGKLAVDGVLLIAEHGRYPRSPTGQVKYPKRRLFSEIVNVFEKSGRVVPVFSDKHLAHNWKDAKWIYDVARRMKIPLMAGSSVPTFRRVPPTDVRRGATLEEIVAVGYGGTESYGFHTLEMLQCLVERRHGGETGVAAVQAVSGEGVWKAAREGRFDRKLLDAALARQTPRRGAGKPLAERVRSPLAFFIEYRDGLKASVLMLNGAASQFSSAWRYRDRHVDSTLFALNDGRPYRHFSTLLKGIEKMMHGGKPAWPAERTLLVTGVLHAAMSSLKQSDRKLATPHLNVRYRSDWNWRQPDKAISGIGNQPSR